MKVRQHLCGVAVGFALAALTLGASATLSAPTTAASIPNLDSVKAEIEAYYTSGNYLHEASAVVARAQAYVDARLREHPRKPAIVLDIDDTALSDYGYEASHDFGYDPRTYDADINAEAFPAIAPTLAFARHVKREGVAVIFVTGRRTPQRAATLGNLEKVGYPVDALWLRPVADRAHSVIPFKSHAREEIEHEGYSVLISMGDQYSDLRGGYADRDFKLPNPMYLVP